MSDRATHPRALPAPLVALLLALVVALVVALVPAVPAGAAVERARWRTEVFSLVPPPGYPAFAYAHPDGRVYAGTYTDPRGDRSRSRVFEWSRRGALLRSWTVPGQDRDAPRGVQVATSDARGRLVLLEKSTARVLLLNPRTGRFRTYATVPDLPACRPPESVTVRSKAPVCSPNLVDKPAIPNFAAWGPRGQLFLTDYGQAVLWRVRPGGGVARPWLRDRRLDGGELGTTGLLLTRDRRALLVAQQSSGGLGDGNPASGKLFRLSLGRGGPGPLRTVWESWPGDLPDGFGIARSGRIYLANAGLSQQLVVLAPDGTELERFPEVPGPGENGSALPFDTPSSATFLGSRVLVANQSYPGNTDHHALLAVEVGERGAPVYVPRSAGLRRDSRGHGHAVPPD